MIPSPVRLFVSDEVRATLTVLLETALALSEGGHVVDHVPLNPWEMLTSFEGACTSRFSAKKLPSIAQWMRLKSRLLRGTGLLFEPYSIHSANAFQVVFRGVR